VQTHCASYFAQKAVVFTITLLVEQGDNYGIRLAVKIHTNWWEVPNWCKNCDLLSQISVHVSGIYMPIFRSTGCMLLHMVFSTVKDN